MEVPLKYWRDECRATSRFALTLLIIFHIKSKRKTHERVGLSQCSRYVQPVAQKNLLLRFVPLALLITFTFEFPTFRFREVICHLCTPHSTSISHFLHLDVRDSIKGHLSISKHCPRTWRGSLLTAPPGSWTASSPSEEDRHDLLMLLHNEMRVLHACLCGYFSEGWWGKQSWQIFPDFINELCRRPQGTKGQKILSMNWTPRGAEEKGWEEEPWSRKLALTLTSLTTPRVPSAL